MRTKKRDEGAGVIVSLKKGKESEQEWGLFQGDRMQPREEN